MAADTEQQQHLARLAQVGQAALTREEARTRQRSLDGLGVPPFPQSVRAAGGAPLVRSSARILQLNTGLYCNQACSHCHVESSPRRKEAMDLATAERCIQLLTRSAGAITTLDITGGAPELHENFRYLVRSARALGVEVIDRCNLTVLLEPGQEDLAQFLAEQQVRVVASLPCYSEQNVDAQRGRGVFDRSIAALQQLNALGYGRPGSGLVLDLVYNPSGAFLAPEQATLEASYKRELWEANGIEFTRLLALNNMPIKRFADWLQRRGQMEQYMQLLTSSFNVASVGGLMCRDTVSVKWDGTLYDCDFNQQLDLAMLPPMQSAAAAAEAQRELSASHLAGGDVPGGGEGGASAPTPRRKASVFDVDSLEDVTGWAIHTGSHCFGCTAGSGSGCQGAPAVV